MSRRIGNISVGISKTPRTKKKPAATIAPAVVQNVLPDINTYPDYINLKKLANIEPFLLPSLIPDLIYLYKKYGPEELQKSVDGANPNDPNSIIFQHPEQNINVATQQIEFDLIKNEPDIKEREDMVCACGSRKIITMPKQTRRADEPMTLLAQCITCKRRW